MLGDGVTYEIVGVLQESITCNITLLASQEYFTILLNKFHSIFEFNELVDFAVMIYIIESSCL